MRDKSVALGVSVCLVNIVGGWLLCFGEWSPVFW